MVYTCKSRTRVLFYHKIIFRLYTSRQHQYGNRKGLVSIAAKIDYNSTGESVSTKFDHLVSSSTLSMRANLFTRCAQETARPIGARQGERGITIFGTSSSRGDSRIHLSLCLPIIIQGDIVPEGYPRGTSRHESRQHHAAIDRFGEIARRTQRFRRHESSKPPACHAADKSQRHFPSISAPPPLADAASSRNRLLRRYESLKQSRSRNISSHKASLSPQVALVPPLLVLKWGDYRGLFVPRIF